MESETALYSGLFARHAYSITSVRSIELAEDEPELTSLNRRGNNNSNSSNSNDNRNGSNSNNSNDSNSEPEANGARRLRLLRIRNPFGDDKEWKLDWSDKYVP